MNKKEIREKKRKTKEPELGVIQSVKETDPFDSFAQVDIGEKVVDLISSQKRAKETTEKAEVEIVEAKVQTEKFSKEKTTEEKATEEKKNDEKSTEGKEEVKKSDKNEEKTKAETDFTSPITSFLAAFSFKKDEEVLDREDAEPIIKNKMRTLLEKTPKLLEKDYLRMTPEIETSAKDSLIKKDPKPETTTPSPLKPVIPSTLVSADQLQIKTHNIEKKSADIKTKTHEAIYDDSVLIELKGLTRRYGYGDATSYALKDFDLTIKRGEFIMVMGPSGCGKTTLLNIIGLLDRATSGEYTLGGEDVAGISHRRQSRLRAKKIGFIFQNFNLISSLPLIENVALPLVYVGRGRTARLKAASDALRRFHLGEREYYYPGQLSGGQQQRAAIARAIVSDPEIILADEPTGNLDSRSSSIVMEELKQIHEEGNTIIMVTHNPNLTAYATRVIHMLDGQIDTDIKTVADHNLPQPVEVKRKRRRRKFRGRVEEEEL